MVMGLNSAEYYEFENVYFTGIFSVKKISLYLFHISLHSKAWPTLMFFALFYHAYQFDWWNKLSSEYSSQLTKLTQSSAVPIKVFYACL